MPVWSRWSSQSVALAALAACGHSAPTAKAPPSQAAIDVERYREQVDAQVQPFLEAELATGVVIGLYDGGKVEIYGFGKGPGGAAPDGNTLFELGSVTGVYTATLLADSVQRREVDLDTPVSELLPLGVTVPVKDKVDITLKHLALHSAGLPAQPPSITARGGGPDPYGGYGENALYNDLIQSALISVPGSQISYSPYGLGLLGFALGRKIGGGYAKAIDTRVLRPLELKDTFVAVPASAAARRAEGSNEDLVKVPAWTFDAMAGAGALVSSVRDQLHLIDVELDAALGGTGTLRRAMKLTQEPQLDRTGDNESLGWLIDSAGKCWHNGGTSGFHAFVGFDPKTRRGVVVLASTASSLLDRLAEPMYKILEGTPPPVTKFPSAAQLAALAGNYDLGGTPLQILVEGKRVYVTGPGEPRHRLSPVSDHEFWIEALQSVAVFEREGDKVTRVVFGLGERRVSAQRIDAK